LGAAVGMGWAVGCGWVCGGFVGVWGVGLGGGWFGGLG